MFFLSCALVYVLGVGVVFVLVFSSCIRNAVPIKVPQGVSKLCEIS